MQKNLYYYFIILFASFIACQNKADNKSTTSILSPIDSISELVKRNTKNTNLLYQRAQLYAHQNKTDLAIADLTTLIAIDSLNPIYPVELAQHYIKKGNSGKTEKTLLKAKRLIPDNAAILHELGQLYFYIKDYRKALHYFDESMAIDRHNASNYFAKAMLLIEINDTNQAIFNLQIAAEKDPQHFDTQLELGILYSKPQPELAILYFNNALQLKPTNYSALYAKAMTYQLANQTNKAIDAYKYLIKTNQFKVEQSYFNIAYNYMLMKENFDSAIYYYDTAINIKPNFIEAYCNRAYCFENLKQKEKAEYNYSKALEIIPNYPLATAGLKRINTN